MQRVITLVSLFALFVGVSIPPPSEAASVSGLSGRARQAHSRAREIKSRGWSKDTQLQIIQVTGPVVLDFVSASDLAQAVKTQRSTVRSVYEALSGPLEEVYTHNFSRLDRLSKAVMDQDGDLEALYETQEWKDAQLLASQSLYFLNWLSYVGSFVVSSAQRTKLLEEAASGFSEFVAGEQSSRLKRESLFGRALCEKELQHFDWAIRDFELLLQDQGLPADMRRKVQLALSDTRSLAARGGGKRPASPEDIAPSQYARAQELFRVSTKQGGQRRRQSRQEAIALVEELRKLGGTWEERADALAQAELTAEEKVALEEMRNPFPPWQQAREHLQKRRFDRAVPLLQEVIASTDPRADRYKRDARYFLGVGLYQKGAYRQATEEFSTFLNTDGVPSQYGPEAAYMRFKAAEALFSRAPNANNGLLYLDATKDFIRRYPRHQNIFEAHFRLGEYYHGQKQYLQAVDSYQKVTGDRAFQVRADFAILQSYFSLLETLEEDPESVSIRETDLRKRIASSLAAFWKDSAELEQKSPNTARRVPLKNYRGRVSFMEAVFLSEDMDTNAVKIADLLHDFEEQYPEHHDAFPTVARTRLVALEKADRFIELEKNVDYIVTHYKPDEQTELLAGLSQVLAQDIKKLERQNGQTDKDNLVAAKRTLAYLYADRLERGEAFAEDESPAQFKYELAQLYLDVRDYDKAIPLYQELLDGPYSLVSLAGLAQIAAVKGNQRQALAYWEQMLKDTRAGDPIWFRGTYEVAQLNAALGNAEAACRTVSGTRSMLSRLADQRLKEQIRDFVAQHCGA